MCLDNSIKALLLDGKGLPVSDIAYALRRSNDDVISPIKKMLSNNTLKEEVYLGKNHYYFLTDWSRDLMPAANLNFLEKERLLLRPLKPKANAETCYARICLGHLAGSFSIRLRRFFDERHYLISTEGLLFLTKDGCNFLKKLGLSFQEKRIDYCLDWTERYHHIGGNFGLVLMNFLVSNGYIRKNQGSRSVFVTELGKSFFSDEFGLSF